MGFIIGIIVGLFLGAVGAFLLLILCGIVDIVNSVEKTCGDGKSAAKVTGKEKG